MATIITSLGRAHIRKLKISTKIHPHTQIHLIGLFDIVTLFCGFVYNLLNYQIQRQSFQKIRTALVGSILLRSSELELRLWNALMELVYLVIINRFFARVNATYNTRLSSSISSRLSKFQALGYTLGETFSTKQVSASSPLPECTVNIMTVVMLLGSQF